MYYMPRCGGLVLLSSQTIATGIILGGTLLTAAYYFYVTSRLSDGRLRSKRNGKGSGAVPALYNLGNTCYANSLLQALASSHAFVNWICDLDTSYVGGSKRPVLIEALRQIMLQLNDPSSSAGSAANVIAALLAHRWTIPANSEQDVYELLNVFITTWDEELAMLKSERVFSLLKVGIAPSTDEITNVYSHILPSSEVVSKRAVDDVQLPDVISGSLSPLAALSFEHKAVADERRSRPPCLGMLATQLQCCQPLCAYKKLRQDKFCVLSLTIPKCFDGMMITLETLLRKLLCAEVIQGASCDRCVEMRNQTCSGLIKKQGFCKLPASLILRVERVGYLPSGVVFKQTDRFAFPETLDVRDFCFYRDTMSEYAKSGGLASESTFRVLGGATTKSAPLLGALVTNESVPEVKKPDDAFIDSTSYLRERFRWLRYKYQLRSVIVHMGQPHSGHFITYRRGIGSDNERSWYKTSDLEVCANTCCDYILKISLISVGQGCLHRYL
ncbi:Ubiquitin carboxyl-terminal hydrolase 30 [Toxocara canis]|uniref:ubiquitinyl hydrolase 1 n=1 Tax=Toxocara canis TaxID=6265 RepID=A0A0B2V960_TOXCA|nr:Ubiquitin carboxyl-terminal hydrolase 30 [Toxocara canis]